MNPCPCGFAGQSDKKCPCTIATVERYQRRVSGPLLDRFDLQLDIPPVPWADLEAGAEPAEPSSVIRERVCAAREMQLRRQGRLNGELDDRLVRTLCEPRDEGGRRLLRDAVRSSQLSVRGVSRVLKVARTLADLSGADRVTQSHLAEALHLRRLDQGGVRQQTYETG
jgi:magnesium chelatase family protein